ncbi:MAG: hypothetical protein QOJ39_2459 [Candidatus Eremiobacteraeota bacterium]|jgi:hypothetical protein|nr:hypothetical protein [Candidatus Eremiobacteraeota bacterium]MEA2720595.1 hypothetical protein [Candidatus Eremiobacteraeota bacterium]
MDAPPAPIPTPAAAPSPTAFQIFRRRREPPAPLATPHVLLIRGCPRSGTTLIAAMINASPDGAVIYEYSLDALVRDLRVLLAYDEETGRRFALAPEGFELTDVESETAYFNDFGDPPYEHYPTEQRFGAIVTAVVEATVGKRDVKIIGSKTPGSVVADGRAALSPYFSDIRYLFMVRNPLDTINSMMNRRNLTQIGADEWEITDIDGAIAEYRQNVLALMSHVADDPAACYVVKFEDLVARSADVVARLEHFLGIPLHDTRRLVQPQTETRIILTAEERARVDAAFGDAIASWPEKHLIGTGDDAVGELAEFVEKLTPGVRYRYGAPDSTRRFLGAAWNVLEEGGVWSGSTDADLFFTVEKSGEYVISVELSCILVGPQSSKSVAVELNGATLFRGTAIATEAPIIDVTSGDTELFPAPGPRTVLCGPVALEAGRVNRLVLRTDDARSPKALGVSEDPRSLGVYLHGLLVSKAAEKRTTNGTPSQWKVHRRTP